MILNELQFWLRNCQLFIKVTADSVLPSGLMINRCLSCKAVDVLGRWHALHSSQNQSHFPLSVKENNSSEKGLELISFHFLFHQQQQKKIYKYISIYIFTFFANEVTIYYRVTTNGSKDAAAGGFAEECCVVFVLFTVKRESDPVVVFFCSRS